MEFTTPIAVHEAHLQTNVFYINKTLKLKSKPTPTLTRLQISENVLISFSFQIFLTLVRLNETWFPSSSSSLKKYSPLDNCCHILLSVPYSPARKQKFVYIFEPIRIQVFFLFIKAHHQIEKIKLVSDGCRLFVSSQLMISFMVS